jgi:hypothetical protein
MIAYLLGTFASGTVSLAIAGGLVLGLRLLPATLRRRAAASAAVFIAALSIADLVLRASASRLLYYQASQPFLERMPAYPRIPRFVPNLDLRSEDTGNLAAMSGNRRAREPRAVRFVTDSYGFCNSGDSKGPHDVILLGDSQAAGNGTDFERGVARRLAARTGRSVFNAALPGCSPWQQYVSLALLLNEGPPLRKSPKLLWMLFSGNDLDESTGPLGPEALQPRAGFHQMLQRYRTWRRRSFVAQLVRQFTEKRSPVVSVSWKNQEVLFYAPYIDGRRRTVEQLRSHPRAAAFRETLGAVRKLAAERELRLQIVLLPSKEEVYGWILDSSEPPPELRTHFCGFLKEIVSDLGIPFMDLGPGLHRRAVELAAEGKLLFWRDDTHLNEFGHLEVAALLEAARCTD